MFVFRIHMKLAF